MKLIPTSTNPVTITLYRNYPFDNSYKETTLLSRKFTYGGNEVGADNNSFLELKNTIGEYIFPRTTKTGTYNFAFGNGLVTSLILELNDEEINTNYIKVECSVTHEIYYYFVTQIIQKNELTYQVNLELDIFMTYGEDLLDIMHNVPVMTERKHCVRVNGIGLPKCSNLIKGDSNFAGVKANISEEVKKLELKILDNNNVKLQNCNWCYVIIKIDEQSTDYAYNENGIVHPYIILCFPLTTMKFYREDNTLIGTINPQALMKFWGNFEKTYKITILPYPPFNSLGTNEIISQSDSEISIKIKNDNITGAGSSTYHIHLNDVTYVEFTMASGRGDMYILEGYGGEIEYESFNLFEDSIINGSPSIERGKGANELALYVPPFKEYKIRTLADEGYKFNPQLRFNKYYNNTSWKTFTPKTIVSTNSDNTSYLTYVNVQEDESASKIGLATNYYYSMPTSYTALQHFLNTASAEYNNAKLINGLNFVASMLVGGLAIANGGAMAQIAGAGAVTSGFIKEVDNITSYYAKMEDLKNTPSNLTTGGSTFTLDYALALSSNLDMYPYVTIFTADKSILEAGQDFFYEYGYEVNRDCYFDTELEENNIPNQVIDRSIFTRTLFNYVKLSEDITTKLIGYNEYQYQRVHSQIPYTIAKKFGEVLMSGIKIWNFFGFTTLQNKVNTDGVYNVFKYFQKDRYSNAEFFNQSY